MYLLALLGLKVKTHELKRTVVIGLSGVQFRE